MIELRWLRRTVRQTIRNGESYTSILDPVLQYRESTLGYDISAGVTTTSLVWSEWRDVPEEREFVDLVEKT